MATDNGETPATKPSFWSTREKIENGWKQQPNPGAAYLDTLDVFRTKAEAIAASRFDAAERRRQRDELEAATWAALDPVEQRAIHRATYDHGQEEGSHPGGDRAGGRGSAGAVQAATGGGPCRNGPPTRRTRTRSCRCWRTRNWRTTRACARSCRLDASGWRPSSPRRGCRPRRRRRSSGRRSSTRGRRHGGGSIRHRASACGNSRTNRATSRWRSRRRHNSRRACMDSGVRRTVPRCDRCPACPHTNRIVEGRAWEALLAGRNPTNVRR